MQKTYARIKRSILIAGFTGLSFFGSAAFAASSSTGDSSQTRLSNIIENINQGWQIKSTGGLLYVNPDDKKYWVSVSGILRIDDTMFSGRRQDLRNNYGTVPGPNGTRRLGTGFNYPSGSNMRLSAIDIVGGIGQDWNYQLELTFQTTSLFRNALTTLGDTWVAYSGLADNVEVFLGRHSGNWFGLEGSTSGSWYPFLERSVNCNAFYPGDGLGLLADIWWDNVGFTFLALQPDQGQLLVSDANRFRSDRWLTMARGTFAPIHEKGDVWHFGLSGLYRRSEVTSNNDPQFAAFTAGSRPDARGRNTAELLSTGNLPVKEMRAINVEMARQWGPLIVQGEYTQGYVKRRGAFSPGSVLLRGWDVQGQYMLTGEIHQYDVRDGYFGGIDVNTPCGAWEIAARYDYANLTDRDVLGGSERNVTVGLNWYVNNNVRVSANYVRALIRPRSINNAFQPQDLSQRKLDIFGMRLQVKFK